MSAVLEISEVSKVFGATHALADFSLSIPQGGVYGCWGRTGPARAPCCASRWA